MKKQWTEPEVRNAVAMWNERKTLGEIGTVHGCGPYGLGFLTRATYRFIRENPEHGNPLPPLDADAIVAEMFPSDDPKPV